MGHKEELLKCPIVPVRRGIPVRGHTVLDSDLFEFGQQMKLLPIVFLPLVGPISLALLFNKFLLPAGSDYLALLVGCGGLVASVATTFLSLRSVSFLCMRCSKRAAFQIAEARWGSIPLSSAFVGVSFTSERWAIDRNASWDTGAFAVELDRIRFRGRKIEFDLAASQILRVDIRRTLRALGMESAVYVTWLDQAGTEQFICIQPREARSTREYVEDVFSLRDRIVALRDGPRFPCKDLGPLPLCSSEMPLSEPEHVKASLPAKVIGLLVASMAFLTGVLLFEWLAQALSAHFLSQPIIAIYLFGLPTYAVGVPWIEKRLPAKWKGLHAPESPRLEP